MAVKVRSNGLEVDGNLLPLVSGTLHYWRLDPEKWSALLGKARDLGFSIIETYVPWSIHETARGEFDFGRQDPAKDIERFLQLAAEKGLKVLLRPGPHINAELSDFGFPRWVLDDPEIQAKTSSGGMAHLSSLLANVPIPSYAQEKLFLEYEPFLEALAPILKCHLYPEGPIVALQVDNEAGYFFNTRTYELDYCDASIKLYQHFLQLKHRTISALNKAYESSYENFEKIDPPRKCAVKKDADLPWHLDWVEYREYQTQWALGRLADLFKSKELDRVPFFHNFFGQATTPYNIPDLEKDSGIDFCGLDSYPTTDPGAVVDQARYLSVSSRLPYIPEFGAGYWLNSQPASVEDMKAAILAPFMGGTRAVNFYMLVERERWTGSPLSRHGDRREELAQLYERFNRFVKELEWTRATPLNQALVLQSRESQHLKAVFERGGAFSEFVPDEVVRFAEPQGLLGGGGIAAADDFYEESKNFLRQKHFSFALGDSGIATEKIKKHAVVFLSAWGYLDEAFARRIKSYVEAGGTLIVGPVLPSKNSAFADLKAFSDWNVKSGEITPMGDGRVLWLTSFDSKLVTQVFRKGKVVSELTLSDSKLEIALHRLGGKHVLFVRNPLNEERPATVYRDGKFVLKPLWSSDKFLGGVEERDVVLRPREIKVWEVIPC